MNVNNAAYQFTYTNRAARRRHNTTIKWARLWK